MISKSNWDTQIRKCYSIVQVLNSEVHVYLPRYFANVVEKKPFKVNPWNCKCWEELFKVIWPILFQMHILKFSSNISPKGNLWLWEGIKNFLFEFVFPNLLSTFQHPLISSCYTPKSRQKKEPPHPWDNSFQTIKKALKSSLNLNFFKYPNYLTAHYSI